MGDHMVRDLITAMFWVAFVVVVAPCVLILFKVTKFVIWFDSKLPIKVGGPWYRFVDWYIGLLLDSVGVDERALSQYTP